MEEKRVGKLCFTLCEITIIVGYMYSFIIFVVLVEFNVQFHVFNVWNCTSEAKIDQEPTGKAS